MNLKPGVVLGHQLPKAMRCQPQFQYAGLSLDSKTTTTPCNGAWVIFERVDVSGAASVADVPVICLLTSRPVVTEDSAIGGC